MSKYTLNPSERLEQFIYALDQLGILDNMCQPTTWEEPDGEWVWSGMEDARGQLIFMRLGPAIDTSTD